MKFFSRFKLLAVDDIGLLVKIAVEGFDFDFGTFPPFGVLARSLQAFDFFGKLWVGRFRRESTRTSESCEDGDGEDGDGEELELVLTLRGGVSTSVVGSEITGTTSSVAGWTSICSGSTDCSSA